MVQGVTTTQRTIVSPHSPAVNWAAVLVLWFFVLFGPLACIVHCHIVPWLFQQDAPTSMFLCDPAGIVSHSTPITPHHSSLPPVVYDLTLAFATLLPLTLITLAFLQRYGDGCVSQFVFLLPLPPPRMI